MLDLTNRRWLDLLAEIAEHDGALPESPGERQALLDRIEAAAEKYPNATGLLASAVVPLIGIAASAAVALVVAILAS